MKILTWNINHRIREKKIPDRMVQAITSLNPHVIVLTEYVPGASRDGFKEKLSSSGMPYMFESAATPRQNHIFIASKSPLVPGEISAPAIHEALPSNVLHLRLPEEGFDILGVRIPDYSRLPRIRRASWDWLLATASSVKNNPFILTGDFNTDPGYPKSRCGDCIGRLINDGWRDAIPSTGCSYWSLRGSGVRIDHAFITDHFTILHTRYITEENGFVYAGRGRNALSDHAALCIDISLDTPV